MNAARGGILIIRFINYEKKREALRIFYGNKKKVIEEKDKLSGGVLFFTLQDGKVN